MDMDVKIKEVPAMKALTFSRAFTKGNPDEMAYFGSLVNKVIEKNDLSPTGPFTSINVEAGDDDRLDVTIAVPINEAPDTIPLDPTDHLVESGDAIVLKTVDGIPKAATYIFEGSESEAMERLAMLRRWAVENGYRTTPEYRLLLHRGPMHLMPDGKRVFPDEIIWEVQRGIQVE